ncbi:MAG TPA: hypothetical protein VHG92_05480 [Afifellaceae bacterium]|nr:hypothetical protein [Afifellaceae bacterium]
MRAILTATALAGALALAPLPALAQQQDSAQPGTESQATPTPETQTSPAPDTQAGQQAGAQAGQHAGADDFRVITSAEDLEGLDFSEVRIDPVDEVPRDHVMAINSALDPANPKAAALRERLGEIEEFEQALSDENVEVERVVGAAIEENELVVYILPEGQTREQWGAQMPAPDETQQPGDAGQPGGQSGAAGADQQPGQSGAAGGSNN